ncbi:Putative NmrA-like domain, NAD(P)-binding domain superfamily [Septoria linicola]|uniref:NmrA-like domain, NAD(P)-binding domain superfamily n=1 Tax=Septoria linicola TaxID=215465 RepID=A0A9Q9EJ68_9PEZI|nr:putative NmrA-like domain, NAD(P)-binding domain superfamily [Septoria linicola]USW51048.1 Putative NmrA-like domain, NAD(P)-binding domain superfamily [Septoria linicola]
MRLQNVALFGANGQIGSTILRALIEAKFAVTAIVQPGAVLEHAESDYLTVKEVDLMEASIEDLAVLLEGVHAVISALNGPALEKQSLLQDAAAEAGVLRFYPSEYGMHHIYRKPDDGQGYLHPLWDQKERANEACLLHPAILDGTMSYTLIGCGDFYDQTREATWCPWAQPDLEEYKIIAVGDATAKVDWTNLADLGKYLVNTLIEGENSHNAHLNFVSDTVSPTEIAGLLTWNGKKACVETLPEQEMHKIVANPDEAPEDLRSGSAFPVDFWFMVKGAQGQGRFRRPPGQIHNHLFPHIEPTRFEEYLGRIHSSH